jgi:tRNA/rRNA methyltransferase
MTLQFWTYMLRCSDGSYYIGHTDDIDVRLAQHNDGTYPGYTHNRRPVELVWSDLCADRDTAFANERKLKGWSRAKKEALIRGEWDVIRQLASRARVLRDGQEPSTSSVSSPPQDERNLATVSEPIIVLVRPQLGENIGKAARAMLNFGLTELRLVSPRDGWPNPSAGPAAAGADLVLEKAEVFETLADAVADCAHVYATTVRKRGVTKPVLTPEQAARAVHTDQGRSAFVFGPERSGLETEDVALARAIVTVPINPEFGSLNLAQAVILLAYEWSKQVALEQPPIEELLPPAPQEELEGLIGQLEEMLAPTGYYLPEKRAVATRRTLRTLLTKPGWNHLEVRTFRGVLSALRKGPRRPSIKDLPKG